ncbi:DNRLRE domain-containing protein [Caldicellulosiruptor sp. DIB 104C]|uniref:DNRLRE domain-containing protein n=1 Tax=Caldicellulosiruptor sp. DIB 104C TaxID=3019889 RepID=UPI0023051047|nr:DNRLRE domain-containing protein [Caldicellulosiruptor sp. DIB 104C]
MSEIILRAKLALSVTNYENENNKVDKKIIFIGRDGRHNFRSLMFFDTSSIPASCTITKAELVLFKVKDFYPTQDKIIKIHALLDYFSFKTTYDNIPTYENFFVEAPIDNSKITAEVNVKDIVARWVDGSLKNKGIILFLNEDKRSLMAFTSFGFPISYLRPILRVEYAMPQIPDIIVSNQTVQVKEEEAILIGNTEAISNSYDTSYILDGTVVAKNEGANLTKLTLECSNDNLNWIEDVSVILEAGQTKIIVPKYYSKFIRFKANAIGNINIKIRYIYKEFMH